MAVIYLLLYSLGGNISLVWCNTFLLGILFSIQVLFGACIFFRICYVTMPEDEILECYMLWYSIIFTAQIES